MTWERSQADGLLHDLAPNYYNHFFNESNRGVGFSSSSSTERSEADLADFMLEELNFDAFYGQKEYNNGFDSSR